MKLAKLKSGQLVETKGYYVAGDAGAGRYLVAPSQIADEYGSHTLTNGVVAVLQHNGVVNVKQFGARGNISNDDRLPIQSAINSLTPFGGVVNFPVGIYGVSEGGVGTCLSIEYPVKLKGDGAPYTAIRPFDSVPATTNTIVISPNVGYTGDFMLIEGLYLGNPYNGQRAGGTGLNLVTTTNLQSLPKFTLRDTFIAGGVTGHGIVHTNANNVEGGAYGIVIENCTIKDGIKLDDSGDSIQIYRCILSGDNIGVEASQIAGASLLSIIDCNITNNGGAIKVNRALRTHIMRNNIENIGVGATAQNDGAVVNISGTNGTGTAGVISQNLVSAFQDTDASILVRIREARGMVVENNTLLCGINGGADAIDVALSQDVRVGTNTFNAGTVVDAIDKKISRVVDSGTGTTGVRKTLTLLNSWVEYSTSETPKAFKDSNGIVHLEGTIKSGTTTYGTPLFMLPPGYAPTRGTLIRVGTYSLGGLHEGSARLEIDEAGSVTIAGGGNVMLTLTGITFSADEFSNSYVLE